MTETLLLLPIFLLMAFALLQLGQLGIATIMVHYAASSIARKASSEQNYSSAAAGVTFDLGPQYSNKAKALMTVGMQYDSVIGCIDRSVDLDAPTGDLVVSVRADLPAWPFFADIIHKALGDAYAGQTPSCPDMSNTGGFGPFNFSAGSPPYTWGVTGNAKARLNYIQ